jgi:hypothetical protein
MSYELYKSYYYIGDGKMEYIHDEWRKELFKTAFQAISLTNNWDFVYNSSSFVLKNDKRNVYILKKIKQLNPDYASYSYKITMSFMQYLVRNGEKKFELFVNKII